MYLPHKQSSFRKGLSALWTPFPAKQSRREGGPTPADSARAVCHPPATSRRQAGEPRDGGWAWGSPATPHGRSGREKGWNGLRSGKHTAKHYVGSTRGAAVNLKLHGMLQLTLGLCQVSSNITRCHMLTEFYLHSKKMSTESSLKNYNT